MTPCQYTPRNMKSENSRESFDHEPELRRFSLSVAGHGEIYKDQSEGTILKGLQPPPNGEREVRFYQEVKLF